MDGTMDGEGLAFPVEVGFGGGCLVGREEVDGPVEVEDGPVEKALAGFLFSWPGSLCGLLLLLNAS